MDVTSEVILFVIMTYNVSFTYNVKTVFFTRATMGRGGMCINTGLLFYLTDGPKRSDGSSPHSGEALETESGLVL